MREEKLDQTVELRMSALHLLIVHGNICLGLRHPDNYGPSRELALEFVNYAENILKEIGVLNSRDIRLIHKTEQEESPSISF